MTGQTARLRHDALAIYESALRAVDGRRCTRKACASLDDRESLQIIAIGKAASAMLGGALDALGTRLTRSLLITTSTYFDSARESYPRCETILTSHPVPDERSLQAGQRLIEFLTESRADQRTLFLISGGSSAMVELPLTGITAHDLVRMNQWLLASGLAIDEMNAVRCAISSIKCGGLLRHVAVESCLMFALSDVPDDSPETIGSGLLHPRDRPLPAGLPRWLSRMCQPQKVRSTGMVPCRIIATADDALRAACEEAQKMGYVVHSVARDLYGDVDDIAQQLADAQRPGVGLHAGEPTVRLPATPGRGGRCQHLGLKMAQIIAGRDGIVYLCGGTDGCDGAHAAGAIIDGQTLFRGQAAGLDARTALTHADAGRFLASAGDLMPVRITGTNVTDLVVKIVSGPT